jgi:metal-dependent hydrolase (beta-lactamase superfamily II)
VLYDRLARFEIGPQQTLTAGLDRLGYAPGDVSTAILSHLHQDHIGGLMVNELCQQLPGLVILPAHDPGAVIRLAEATSPARDPAA